MSGSARAIAIGYLGFAVAACSSGDAAAPGGGDAGGVDATSSADSAAPPVADGGTAMDADTFDTDAGGTADADAPDTAPPPTAYTNPVLDVDFPDPFVLPIPGGYLAFATNGNGKNVQVASSSDLATWSPMPDALPTLPSWAKANAGLTWAPSVLERAGTYVLYYTARDVASGFQCVSRATSTDPAGPYVDTSAAPLVCQTSGSTSFCGSIDPSPFVDADGTPYLLWKSDENAAACRGAPRLWSAPLAADGLSLAGPATALLTKDEAWEDPIIEGPSMALVGGTYYLVYSANAYESAAYAMGYATCLSPSGPCVKRTTAGPFVKSTDTALGPGGGEWFVDDRGRRWLAYHAWTAPATTYAGGGARSLRIDPITASGVDLVLAGPTTTAQSVP